VTPSFEPLVSPDDTEAAIELLTSNEWPFHGLPYLSHDQAAQVRLAGDDIASFWAEADSERIGLIRVFDLDDRGDGSPLFDVRIAAAHRGRGVGTAAVSWLTDHLFTTYAELHRIEATTRHDNVPMQRVFGRCGFRLEGQMLESWKNADGSRADTWTYAILRREWRAQPRRLRAHHDRGVR
jgi:RimJ/RimL family protein N-acetyltransferase